MLDNEQSFEAMITNNNDDDSDDDVDNSNDTCKSKKVSQIQNMSYHFKM